MTGSDFFVIQQEEIITGSLYRYKSAPHTQQSSAGQYSSGESKRSQLRYYTHYIYVLYTHTGYTVL